MKRADKEIRERREIEAVIEEARVCRLGLSDGGEPYVVPLCFGRDGDTIYFHGDSAGRKLDVIRRNDRVCVEFDVVDGVREGPRACAWSVAYRSVIAFGRARVVLDPAEKRRALGALMAQYSKAEYAFPEESVLRTTIVAVRVERMTGKRSGGVPAKGAGE